MAFDNLARRAALALPRVRRFYDYARVTQAELVSSRVLSESLAQDKSRLARELEQAQAALEAAVRDREALSRNLEDEKGRLARESEVARAALQSARKDREAFSRSVEADKAKLTRELEEARAALQSAMRDREALSRSLDTDKGRLAQDLEHARAALREAEEERSRLSRDLGLTQAAVESSRRERAALSAELNQALLERPEREALSRELAAANAAAQAASKEREDLELQNYVLRSDLNRSVNTIEELRTSLQQAEHSLAAAETAAQALREQETAWRTERAELERKLTSAFETAHLLKEKEARWLTTVGAFQEAQSAWSAEKAALERRIAEGEQDRAAAEQSVQVPEGREQARLEAERVWQAEKADLERKLADASNTAQLLREGEARWLATVEAFRQAQTTLNAEKVEVETQLVESEKNRAAVEQWAQSLQSQEKRVLEAERSWQAEKADLEQRLLEAFNTAQLLREGEARWLTTVEAFQQAQAVWAAEKAELTARVAEGERLRTTAQPEAEQIAALNAQLETSSSRLLARLSLVSSDLKDLKRLSRSGDGQPGDQPRAAVRQLYLDLLEKTLIGSIYEDAPISPWSKGYDSDVRLMGRDWPANAHTMIGGARMRNVRVVVESIIADDIPGDLIEAGVWRGGACIYMRGILAAYDVSDRKVWVADSFAGLPPPSPNLYPADAGDLHHQQEELAIPLEQVRSHFDRYDLLDDQVVFLPGWFKDTLPSLPVEKLALLRLDGDMYQSTMETLEALYAKVAVGGYVIVDDYILGPCKQAIHDFRARYNIVEPIEAIDGAGVYWRKQSELPAKDVRAAVQNGSRREGSKAVARHASPELGEVIVLSPEPASPAVSR